MPLMTALYLIVGRVIDGVQQGPEAEDVKAGWVAFAVFLLLAAAVAFLGLSLVKQLRKAQAAKDAGVYGDEPARPEGEAGSGPVTGGPGAPTEPGDPSRG